MTILVVEDEKPLLDAIGTKLEKSGLEALTARSCEQALGYIEDVPHIDAVWLDHYLLGQQNGLDFVATLKKQNAYKHIPIFVVTNTGGAEKRQTYLRLGAVQYYIKSNHRLDEIILDIKKFLNTTNKNDTLPRTSSDS